MARALARGGAELVLYNRTRGALRGAGRRARRARRRLGRGGGGGRRRRASRCSLTARRCERPGTARTGSSPARATAAVLVDMSTVPPDTLARFEAAARERGAGILDAPVSGSVDAGRVGPAHDHGRRHRRRPGACPAGARPGGEAGHPRRPARQSGAALKLAVNALIFALNNASARRSSWPSGAGIDRALAYDVFASSAAGAPFVGLQARGVRRRRTRSPVAFSLDLAAKDLRLITRAGRSARRADGPGARQPGADRARPSAPSAPAATSPPSPSTCGR